MWVSSYCLSISDVYCWWAFAMGCVERRKQPVFFEDYQA